MSNYRPEFDKFIKENPKLATASEEELREELESRSLSKPFPLHVFNEKIKPFLDALHNHYDLPRSYIGLALLTTYSTAIGVCYHLEVKKIGEIYLPIWACLEGISSSGKSLVMKQVFKPLIDKQKEYDKEAGGLGEEANSNGDGPDIKQIIYRDSHVQTLIRYVMPANPKGILKDADEILEWIHGMNQLSRKEGTDEQFWMSGWNCKPYTAIRARNQKYHLPSPFVNVFGGIQPSVLYKLFKNGRDKTGFIFRLLFAVPDRIKIADVDLDYDMPEEFEKIHKDSIDKLIEDLTVEKGDVSDYSKKIELSKDAIKEYRIWSTRRQNLVNRISDSDEMEIQAGILGKIKEYCLRFSAILHIADISYQADGFFGNNEVVSASTMARAIELADYFYESATNVSERVARTITAPPEVLRYASYANAGFSFQKMGDLEFNDKGSTPDSRKKKAERAIKKMIKDYPKVFRADAK
ncbi:DUF3987 domain-containing protein [Roseivirga seohaensis]|uniref:DUF3987 domain-containing protein n=1 Tax=Roseivirga seohaensis TaxID=1914963 RepID=UPI003BABC270